MKRVALALNFKEGYIYRMKEDLVTRRQVILSKIARVGWSVVRAVLVIGICFIILQPWISKFCISIMDEQDIYDITVRYVPKHFTFNNYKMAWGGMEYPKSFFNSLKLSLMCGILQLLSCTVIAYGFARFNFPFKNFIFALVILTLLVPPQTIMIPLFLHFRFFDIFGIISSIKGDSISLLDSYWPFILMSMTGMGLRNGLYIYVLRQHFRGMPKDLEDAAYVDGSGFFRTFLTIMLPSAVPMMVTVFLFSFVWQWTDTFYTTLFLKQLKVLPSALSSLAQNLSAQYFGAGLGQMNFISPGFYSLINNTGSILVILPLLLVYLFGQKYFVQSIERSGLVG